MNARLVLYAFTVFYIGRLHELVAVLQPLKVILILSIIGPLSAFVLPPSDRHELWKQREVRLVASLGLLAFVLLPFSVWPGMTFSFLTQNFLRVVILFALVVTLTTSVPITKRLVMALIVATVVLSLFTLYAGESRGDRAYVTDSYDPNDLALVLDCVLPFSILGMAALSGLGRITAVAGVILSIITVVKTGSRGGFVGLVVVGVLIVLRWRGVSLVGRLTVLGLGAALLMAVVPANYWYSVSTLLDFNPPEDEGYLESGMLGRTELWKQGFSLFLEYFLTGAGAGVYEVAEGMSHGGAGKWSAAHNSFIQLATELGIVGITVFIALFVISIRNARAAARAAATRPELAGLEWMATALEMALYAFAIVGFALSQAYSPLLYFFFALATALRLQVEKHQAPVSPPALARDRRRARPTS